MWKGVTWYTTPNRTPFSPAVGYIVMPSIYRDSLGSVPVEPAVPVKIRQIPAIFSLPRPEKHEKSPESPKIPGFYSFYRLSPVMNLAERQGFEPWVETNPHTRLAGEHHRPTRSPLRIFVAFPGGGSRIRTHGALAQRFSRPPPSTARPSLQQSLIYQPVEKLVFIPKYGR